MLRRGARSSSPAGLGRSSTVRLKTSGPVVMARRVERLLLLRDPAEVDLPVDDRLPPADGPGDPASPSGPMIPEPPMSSSPPRRPRRAHRVRELEVGRKVARGRVGPRRTGRSSAPRRRSAGSRGGGLRRRPATRRCGSARPWRASRSGSSGIQCSQQISPPSRPSGVSKTWSVDPSPRPQTMRSACVGTSLRWMPRISPCVGDEEERVVDRPRRELGVPLVDPDDDVDTGCARRAAERVGRRARDLDRVPMQPRERPLRARIVPLRRRRRSSSG